MNLIKGIFWEMPVDFWNDGLFGKLMATLWLSVTLTLLAIICFLCFLALDGAFLSYVSGEAKVVGKRFDPAHTDTYMQTVLVGKSTVLIPQTTSYPDRYYLRLEVNGLIGEKQVEKSLFEEIHEGKIIGVKYSKRRITNSISYE